MIQLWYHLLHQIYERTLKQLLKRFSQKKSLILEFFGKQRKAGSLSLWSRKIHTVYIKSMRNSFVVGKITYVKPNEMLLILGMNMKIQTKIQKHPSISFKTLIMFFNDKFWCQLLCQQKKRPGSMFYSSETSNLKLRKGFKENNIG